VKKKLHKKLQIKSETLRYLDRAWGGSAADTCYDTCGEPETGTCTYASNALACASFGCGSTVPGCQATTLPTC